MKVKGDNPNVLCQDCSVPLFRWFLSRVDWVRILKSSQQPYVRELGVTPHVKKLHM